MICLTSIDIRNEPHSVRLEIYETNHIFELEYHM